MKLTIKLISILLTICCAALLFAACEKPVTDIAAGQNEGASSATDVPASEAAGNGDPEFVTDAPEEETDEDPAVFTKEGYLKLFSYGVEQEVYEYFCWGTSVFYEDGEPKGMLHADGEGFFTSITDKVSELPVIENYCRTEGLDIRIINGARITQIRAYEMNNDYESSFFTSKEEFDRFFIESTGSLLIDVTVLLEGPYIEELDDCEKNAMGYAFIIFSHDVPEPIENYGSFDENGSIKVISEGKTLIPFRYSYCCEVTAENGVVTEYCAPLAEFLPIIEDSLPVACRAGDVALDVYEWASLRGIDVYNYADGMIAEHLTEWELYDLIETHGEELIVDVHACVEGCEAFETGHRLNVFGHVFKICSAEFVEAGAPVEEHAGSVTVYGKNSNGGTGNILPFEFYVGSNTAYYENGVYAGMLCAVGKGFYYMLPEVYTKLPSVYSRDFKLNIEGAELLRINLYNEHHERLCLRISPDELYELARERVGELICEVVIGVRGDYVPEADEHETLSIGYAFIIK